MTVAVVVAVALAAACGSGTEGPTDAASGGEPTAAGTAAPADGTAAAGDPPAGVPASVPPEPAEVPASVPPEPAEVPASVPPAPPSSPVSPPSPPAAPVAEPPRPQRDASGAREFPPESVWEGLRQCQSRGDYGFVHPSGQYFGAYQFTVATWDRLASQRYTDLLGVLPSQAEPADQDRMAYYLWIESGHARWPACSHVFTGDPPTEAAATVIGDGGASPPPAAVPDGTSGETATPGTDGTGAQPDAGATGTASTSPVDLPELEIDPSVQPAVPPDVAGFPTEEQWEALRICESSGNYRVVSRDGRYYGAYQFWPETWDSLAARHYPRLVGVLPSHATPEDQTRMAYKLWEERGDQPWPICGRHLRSAAGGQGG